MSRPKVFPRTAETRVPEVTSRGGLVKSDVPPSGDEANAVESRIQQNINQAGVSPLGFVAEQLFGRSKLLTMLLRKVLHK